MNLTKQDAVAIFGTQSALAKALGLTKSAISQWPDNLGRLRAAAVIGAAVQAGKPIPTELAQVAPQPKEAADA